MKLKKYSSGSLFTNKNPNFKNISNKILTNISKFNSKKNSKYHHSKNIKISIYKKEKSSNNIILKDKKNINTFYKHNSKSSLIFKSYSEIRFKTDIGINKNNSINYISTMFSNKKVNKIGTKKFLVNNNRINSLPRIYSSRNLNKYGNSFELLKTSNEEIIQNGKKTNYNKYNYSININNKLKTFNLIKNKNNFNLSSKLKDKLSLKNNKNKSHLEEKENNNKFDLLTSKNKIIRKTFNISLLIDKYLLNSTNSNLYNFDKENISTNANKYCSNLMINNSNRNTNKSSYLEFQSKLSKFKNLSKNRNNLIFTQNSKLNKLINQTDVKKASFKNKTDYENNKSNIKKLPKISQLNSTKFYRPINLKKKYSQKLINNNPLYDFILPDKSYKKNKSKLNNKVNGCIKINFFKTNKPESEYEIYEGVEMKHFKIVKFIQENKE